MSYQVLARKWRPQRFSEVVGQQHVLSALENGLREGRLHHAYLFSGTRGVGKTSIARLFAKGLNCEQGITPNPCGNCANCKAIEEGRFIDLIEIDAASRTKVEDTRELLDNVQYKPTVGRFKVYLIDEVHMLSRHSFNALLKTLEEPPEYVKFLLATTDPQKLPITILSRCMQFHLRALEQSQIRDHLEFVLKQEQIPFELTALEKLAKAAQGSIRDSLSLTDQAIAVSNANITLPVVSQMLGLIDDHQPLELVQALALGDAEKAMAVVQLAAEKGVDWQQLLSDIAETLHKIAMLQLLSNNGGDSQLHFLARQTSPEDIQLFYQIMLMGKKELPFSPEPRSGVEMTILRALAFHPKRVIENSRPVPVESTSSTQPVAMPQPVVQRNATQSTALSAAPQATQMPEPAVRTPQPNSTTRNAQTNQVAPAAAPKTDSVGLAAANAFSNLLNQKTEKKNTKISASAASTPVPATAEVAEKVVEQAVRNAPFSAKNNANRQKTAPAIVSTPLVQETQQPAENRATTPQNDEEYRWTWLDPELANDVAIAKPSDIKQAILQEHTPEILEKLNELACEQDELSRLIKEQNLFGFARQVLFNSIIQSRTDSHISLLLKPHSSHLLDIGTNRNTLNNFFNHLGVSYDIQIGEDLTKQTPLEIRRTLFEHLSKEAKDALLADDKLNLLMKTFNAELDESTIRAVVSNK